MDPVIDPNISTFRPLDQKIGSNIRYNGNGQFQVVQMFSKKMTDFYRKKLTNNIITTPHDQTWVYHLGIRGPKSLRVQVGFGLFGSGYSYSPLGFAFGFSSTYPNALYSVSCSCNYRMSTEEASLKMENWLLQL